jgi:UDP-glucose 4-epimerase
VPRALVTGGAGFIGSHVADRFVAEQYDVHVIDDLSSGKQENLNPAATFHRLDVRSRDAAALVAEGGFDVLIHLAGQMDVRKSVADPVFDADVNIVGTLNMMEAVRRSGRPIRIVFTSTGGVLYGTFTTPPNVETFPKDPESPYAISKLAVEYYLAYYGRVHALDAAVLRFGNVYGPRQDPHGEAGVVAIFCNRILANSPLTIFGDGRQTRDYIHVSDVVEAAWIVATTQLPAAERLDARAFNIGTAVGTSVLDIAAHLQRAAGSSLPVEFAPNRRGEQQESFIAIDKANRVLGWTPKIELADGLAATYEWFAANRSPRTTAKS